VLVRRSIRGRPRRLGQYDSLDDGYLNSDPSVGPVTGGNPQAVAASQAIAAEGTANGISAGTPYNQNDYITALQQQLEMEQQNNNYLANVVAPPWYFWAAVAIGGFVVVRGLMK
jgi:hypothetical protein